MRVGVVVIVGVVAAGLYLAAELAGLARQGCRALADALVSQLAEGRP